MTAAHLPNYFASQSPCSRLLLSQRVEHDRALIGLVEAAHYPAADTLRLDGLRPSWPYRLRGAAEGYCRTDADGGVLISLELRGATLLIVAPVV